MLAWAVLAGAAAGLGVALLIGEFVPARPDLATALANLNPHTTIREATHSQTGRIATLYSKIGRVLGEAARRYRVPIPARDLNILAITPERFLLTKAGLGMAGLAIPAVLATVSAVAGVGLPIVMSAAVCVALGVGGFVLPDVQIRRRAGALRWELRRACCSYLDLITLERLGDAGAVDAAERAAKLGGGWVFARIRDALLRAQLAGHTPWTGLAKLGDDTGVTELADIGDIISLSGQDGASIHSTLRARARSLRATIAAERAAEANAASERLVIPAACMGLCFLALIAYPALTQMATGT